MGGCTGDEITLFAHSVADSRLLVSPASYTATVSSWAAGSQPRGVAVDTTRQRVYVVDDADNKLYAYSLKGAVVWSKPVDGPWDAAVDPSTGRIFVSQYTARAVLVFDYLAGLQVLAIGQTSKHNYGEPGYFNGPAGLAVTGAILIVCDADNFRFQASQEGLSEVDDAAIQ